MMNFRRTLRLIGYHFVILCKGFAKMLFGVATAALLVLGIWGFVQVSSEGGYAAVFDFLGSICIICIALGGTYIMGGRGKKGAKR